MLTSYQIFDRVYSRIVVLHIFRSILFSHKVHNVLDHVLIDCCKMILCFSLPQRG